MAGPSAPPAWENESLLRLQDPRGDAIAWVSPENGGNTIAFAVLDGDDWRQVLFLESPAALRARPTRYGCPVLFPFPGYARGARYIWEGEARDLPINAPDGRNHVHGFAHDRPWQVTELRDDSAILEFATYDALSPKEREAYPFDIVVRQTVSVSDGTLKISVDAENRGSAVAPVGLGLHPYVDPRVLSSNRSDIMVRLPGTLERALEGPVPAGEPRSANPHELSPAEGGTLLCRTGLDKHDTVAMRGHGGRSVHIALHGDWSDVVLFVPSDQPSLAIEPLTCALSAASASPGSPESLPPLAPSEHVAGHVRLHLA